MNEEILLASEVARRLGRSAQSIRNLADKNQIPCLRTLGGVRMFKLADVRALEVKLRRPAPVSQERTSP